MIKYFCDKCDKEMPLPNVIEAYDASQSLHTGHALCFKCTKKVYGQDFESALLKLKIKLNQQIIELVDKSKAE